MPSDGCVCTKCNAQGMITTLFYRGSLADIRRCLSSSRINIAVVSAEREYLCLINLVPEKQLI